MEEKPRVPVWKRILRTAGLTLGVIALLGTGLVVFFEDKLIYFPVKDGVGASPGEEVWLDTADGVRIHGWYLPRPGAKRAILHLHGNAGNLEDRRDLLKDLSALDAAVFAIDYRGYGKSAGAPSEPGLYADAKAAFDWLRAREPSLPLVLHGESLGGAVAVELASKEPCAALIVQSTFTSTRDMASQVLPWFPARWLMRSNFDNLSKVRTLKIPKLFLHSRDDEMIPFAMAERLFEAAAEPKEREWFKHAGHNELTIRFGRAYFRRLELFLKATTR